MSSSTLPAKIGRYDIRAKLADGSTATVYVGRLSEPAGLDELQAIKVIKPELSADRNFTHVFLDEARIAAELSHPSIVRVHELGEDTAGANKRLYVAMELLFGESLWDIGSTARAKEQKLPDDVVAWIGARAAEGLHHAHELASGGVRQNVVHRDVNPSHVFVTYDGQVKIIDFGLAKAKNSVTETGLGVIKGKVAYMAPEQTKTGRAASPSEARDRSQSRTADLDHRADLFALGIALYELTAGTRLFKRKDDVETLAAVAACEVPDPTASHPDYSPALWEILKKALSKDREARYQSGKEMADALDAFSRSRGRVITASTVAAFMEELFGAQRERYQKWLDEVRSGRLAPAAEERSFRGPTSADENALIVGAEPAPGAGTVTDRNSDRPSDVRGFGREPAKRPDPFAPPPKALDQSLAEARASSRAWLWALVLLVASIATVWWASHRF